MERYDTVVIGGGQAGLVAGYHLAQTGRDFRILEADERVGDVWRKRWDSMRLFTPARYDGLAGLRFPGPRHAIPTKDEFADYLETYARTFKLPVEGGVRVDTLIRRDGRFVITAGARTIEADNVVVGTGAHHVPKIPPFASELDPSITQVHSSVYKNPSQLRPGRVLVVGVGNSGADISLELSKTHRTWLAGKESAVIPFRIDTFKARYLVRLVRFLGYRVLTRSTPVGRKVGPKLIAKATPLIRVKPKDIEAAGVERVPRVVGVRDGMPLLDDGRVLEVENVIWCTGFRDDFSWIDLPITGDDGAVEHERGVATRVPGLYFVGLMFQYAMTSDTITGVSRDAAYVVEQLVSRAPAREEARVS